MFSFPADVAQKEDNVTEKKKPGKSTFQTEQALKKEHKR